MKLVSRGRRLMRGLALSVRLLLAHRLRTVLSVSGLLVGVAAVTVMVAIGQGAEQRVLSRVRAMGTDLVVAIAAPAPRVAGRQRQVDVHTVLRAADADAIAEESRHATGAAAGVSRSTTANVDGLNTTTILNGTTVAGLRIRNIRAQSGRIFDEDEDRQRRLVALVGQTVVRNIFKGGDPVGRVVRIERVRLEVIGVTAVRGVDIGGADLDNVIVIPLETAMRRVLNIPYVHAIFAQARGSDHLDALERDVRDILDQRHPRRSGMPDPYVVQNQAALLRTERGAAQAMNRLIVGVAVLALLVGGVGILSVMLMSVRERTREIGLRRALGARRHDIQLQFVLESALLAVAGGAAGVVVGVAAAGAAAALGHWDLIVSWRAAVVGIAGSLVLGLAVGALPAARAARLEPIAALRAD